MSDYRLDHFGITVSDIEKSISFYEDNFGFKKIKEVDKPGLKLRLATLQLESSILELIEPYQVSPTTIDSKVNSLVDLLKQSKSHIAISTDKLSFAYSKLKENSIEIVEPSEKSFFCKDPDENLIEIRSR
jgi:catechol 2,3-dioxygenase-like lactoylglutathione lyase family enzyme